MNCRALRTHPERPSAHPNVTEGCQSAGTRIFTLPDQWRRSQVKSGGINIEKSEGVGLGKGCVLPQLGVWGLAPEKKSILH